MIPNATGDQLASQARLEQRVAAILERHAAGATAAGQLLYRRPDLASLTAPGPLLAELTRWSA
jgi:hypothetical protein